MNIFYLDSDDIRRDEGRFQLRASTSPEAVERLADSMRRLGFQELHPLSVWKEGDTWWLIDGFHRQSAARLAGINTFPCVEFVGTAEEAFAYGVSQNRDHGRQLDEKTDYRHAAKMMRSAGMTFRAIAQVLWPTPKEKWRKVSGGSGLDHPKRTTVKNWLDPNYARARDRARGRKNHSEVVINRLIREMDPDCAPSALEPDEYKAKLEQALVFKETKAEAKARRDAELEEKAIALKNRLLDSVGDVPDWVVNASEADSNRGVPCTIWSDWHFGEVVRMNGKVTFDVKIAEERIRRLVERTISLCFNHMGKAEINYPGIVVRYSRGAGGHQ
jgi:hypothetical protein